MSNSQLAIIQRSHGSLALNSDANLNSILIGAVVDGI
jgi:hypothetical protein